MIRIIEPQTFKFPNRPWTRLSRHIDQCIASRQTTDSIYGKRWNLVFHGFRPCNFTGPINRIDSLKIGVSVTRAFAYPPETPYTNELAEELLEKKLAGVLESSANVSPEDAWEKQILHILAYTPDHQARVLESYQALDPSLTADTIVVVTSTEGEDAFLY